MKNLLLVTLATITLALFGFNASAADEKPAASSSGEEESVYVQIATACQSKITPEIVSDAMQRQDQIAGCIETGIVDSIEGGE